MKLPSILDSALVIAVAVSLMVLGGPVAGQVIPGGGGGDVWCMRVCDPDPVAFCVSKGSPEGNGATCQTGVCTGDTTGTEYPHYVICP